MINYKYLPEYIKNQLRGYQSFKKIGIEFTNIHNNRQDCSPARSTMFTSEINHGVSDDIQEDYQYEYFPYLNEDLDTIGKIYKRNGYDFTAFYGKNHMDARLTNQYQKYPAFTLNTRGAMKSYGFDIFNTFGDTSLTLGILGDNREFQSTVPPSYINYDYKENDMKLVGIIPFLKARAKDNKSFHAQFHMVNPHDTMQLYQNTSIKPINSMTQFLYPYHLEQSKEIGYINPFIYNDDFTNAWVEDKNLVENFFEDNYEDYCNITDSLPFKKEYLFDYVSNPDSNNIIPIFAGSSLGLNMQFSMANSKEDIKSWKNLINNYYGLVKQTDEYLYSIYMFLLKNDMLKNTSVIITSDHGDQVSSHGLKQKGFPFKESENIPLIIYSPHLNKNYIGKENNILGSHLDLNPTFEEISNLNIKSELFRGKSLLNWKDNKLIPTKINRDVIHICNSTMHLEASYIGYLDWKKQNKDKDYNIIFDPKNLFEFQYSFIMLITQLNGKQYKFCKFFTYKQILECNLNDININKSYLLEISKDYYNTTNSKEFTLMLNKLPDNFTFGEGLSQIIRFYGENDSSYLFNYFFIMNCYLLKLKNGVIKLFGIDKSYKEQKDTNMFLCWNTTDDTEELYNLCNTENNEELFEYLNDKLNKEITKQGGNNFLYSIPIKIIDKIDQTINS